VNKSSNNEPTSQVLSSLSLAPITWMCVCFGYMCGNGFLALHWIYMNMPFESIKVEWTWTQNGGVFGVPMLSYPNPYISTTLGSRVVVWVFGWLVNDTQNTNFANLGDEESHIKCALSNPCPNPFLLPHHV
jgi:hypothetical protein